MKIDEMEERMNITCRRTQLTKRKNGRTCLKWPLYKRPQFVSNTNSRFMQVKNIAKCSNGSILQYFRPSLSYNLSLRSLFCLFLSGHLRHVSLYCSSPGFHLPRGLTRSFEHLTLVHANNQCADQPAHPRSLISAFVIRSLDSIVTKLLVYCTSNGTQFFVFKILHGGFFTLKICMRIDIAKP